MGWPRPFFTDWLRRWSSPEATTTVRAERQAVAAGRDIVGPIQIGPTEEEI